MGTLAWSYPASLGRTRPTVIFPKSWLLSPAGFRSMTSYWLDSNYIFLHSRLLPPHPNIFSELSNDWGGERGTYFFLLLPEGWMFKQTDNITCETYKLDKWLFLSIASHLWKIIRASCEIEWWGLRTTSYVLSREIAFMQEQFCSELWEPDSD